MPIVKRAALFCGDRKWASFGPIARAMRELPIDTAIISGGASGADMLSAETAKNLGMRSIVLEAPWIFYKNRAGPIRNQWMLELLLMFRDGQGATIEAHAFHDSIATSKGTADMLGRLKKAGVPYTIHTMRSE